LFHRRLAQGMAPRRSARAASRPNSIKRLLCRRTAVGRPAVRLQGPVRCDSRISVCHMSASATPCFRAGSPILTQTI
jgi:hypothetical protein